MPIDYIYRSITCSVEKVHRIMPVATITGPRQSGKTTLCRHLYPEMQYVNFENIQWRSLFEENPVAFLDGFENGAIIDEAQLMPEVFKALQTVVDEDRFRGKRRKFVVTGSSNFSIMAKSAESMAGRTSVLTLLPLSVRELMDGGFNDVSTSELMFNGGYPQIWTSGKGAAEVIIPSYIDTYVERDLRQLINVKDLNKFMTFIRLCAGRIGTELNRSSLAVETGVTVATVDAWLSVLEASFVIWLLPPWSTNLNKRLTKSPKLYFYDTGLVCSLLGIIEASQVERDPLRGAIFENMVLNDFAKAFYNIGQKPRMTFFRDKTGREIDLLVETRRGLHAFEVKASKGFNPDYFRHIRYFENTFADKLVSAAIVYDGDEMMSEDMSGLYNFRSVKIPEMLDLFGGVAAKC